ncbi:carboxylesterase [Rhodofomes roseus]|uniref:Carboxylic ester hydrolase n=1 Tax=Rhodofomes roseus TaxID=34475 RepID=A0ABQ8KEC1_9APHY|nr:carboxylesterase [Rhodofomes roseus]KAH9836084.1 carboxylesterase [Rhodofomes roseus]
MSGTTDDFNPLVPDKQLQDELTAQSERLAVNTKYGSVTGGRAANGAAAFLEIPYAILPGRWQDPQPLPADYRYEDKDYIYESSYCAQPLPETSVPGLNLPSLVGLGKPTEDPLFLNVVCPPQWTPKSPLKYPVLVYIHGGFLQTGSPHELNSQGQHLALYKNQVVVNIGYRVSILGFLACDSPDISGNFGFKDQWQALLWIQDNISAFGGDPTKIQIAGDSAGAHSCHQILHYVSRLPEGQKAPFQSAFLQSNGLLTTPSSKADHRPQFQAVCKALGLDPSSPTVLTDLRDPTKYPAQTIMTALLDGAVPAPYDTFRDTIDGVWVAPPPEMMEWQRSGDFARGLKAKGVKYIIMGNLTEEWYVYGIIHPVHTMADCVTNMERYFSPDVTQKLFAAYPPLPDNPTPAQITKFMGTALSDAQVYIPLRILARDLANAGYPVLRYEIGWVPEQLSEFTGGYVSHGTDRVFWAYRLPLMKPAQIPTVNLWLGAVDAQVALLKLGTNVDAKNMKRVFALKADKSSGWQDDSRWDELMQLASLLPGEK